MIIFENLDKIGHVTISSGKGNMLDQEDMDSLLNIVRSTQNDSNVRGLVVRGSNRCFSTGLKVIGVHRDELDVFFRHFDTLLLELFSYPKPVIVAVDGHSIGGGLLLQCCADYIVAVNNPKIKIGLPELNIGLTVDELMLNILEFNTGNISVLQQLLYSGNYIDVSRGEAIGFVDCVVDIEDVSDKISVEMTTMINFDVKAFAITKSKLRATTIGQMKTAFNNKCYEIFKKNN